MVDPTKEADVLRQLIREAHEAAKDLRAAIKEAREVAPTIVSEQLNAAVTEQVGRLGNATEEAIGRAVEKVNRQFDRLAKILMGETGSNRKRGDTPIPELVEQLAREEARRG